MTPDSRPLPDEFPRRPSRRLLRTAAAEKLRIEYPAELPISAKVPELREAWRNFPLILVGGATGSGKTTQLPKVALELGCGRRGVIGCTQPRRLAATAMARRLALELGCEYGEAVGSQVRFEDHTQNSTVLKFMTDGILLAELRDDPLLHRYDCLIIDEAHERTLNIDFLLGLLKNLMPRRPDLKIAVSSATLDMERFSAFFPEAPVIEVEGRAYPVEDVFLPPLPDEELPLHVARAVDTLLRSCDAQGDVLVFLPGEREIRECADMLTGRLGQSAEILQLYARLSGADQQQVFRPGRKRRIILSTNVAETSLTIPRIRFCIDSGLARISRYNPRTRIQELQIEMISQASARQRRGRCGRTADGICIHLYGEEDLKNADPFTDPELKRSSLAGVILQMAALKLPEISRFPFIDPPQSQLIREGMRTLTDVKAITAAGALTPDGRMLARLPLDPQLGKMLLAASPLKVVPQLLVVAAGLSVGDVRERPAEKTQAADDAHRRWKDERSDFLAMLKLWNDLAVCDSNGLLRKFCLRNYLNFRRVREWRNLVVDLADAIRYREAVGKVDQEPYEQIHEAILCGIPRNIARYDEEEKLYRGTDGKKFYLFPGSGLTAKKRRPPEWIVTFHLVETSRVFGRTCAEINPAILERCAGHLCSRIYDQEHYEKESGFVRAREKVTLGGLIVHAGRKVDFGRCNPAAAREIFIREGILEGLVRLPRTPIARFNAIREELAALELKMRRPESLYDAIAAERFFLANLPLSVNSVHSLKAFFAENPDALTIRREELMLEQFTPFDPADYPDFLTFGGVKFPLAYRFEPGEPGDGVTLLVPENQLNLLPDRVLEYPIPGYFADFGEKLMRSLPKEIRRQLGGIPDASHRFADYLKNDLSARELSPAEAMAEFLLYDADLEVDPKLVSTAGIPEALQMKLGVLNDAGRLKEVLHELPERSRCGSKVSAALPGTARHTASHWVEWPGDDGVMPQSVEVPPGSHRLAYPALVDEGESVGKQLFLKVAEAKRRHAAGVIRLFRLGHAQQAKYLKRSLKLSNELRMSLVLGSDAADFERELLDSSLAAAADCDLWEIRSALQFDALAKQLEMEWAAETDALASALERYTADVTAIRTMARRAKEAGAPLIEHLELLFAPGFLRRPAVRDEYPRYLRALKLRAERLVNAPGRDAVKGEILEPWIQRFNTALGTLDDLTDSDGLYDFWLLLEECRIAVYAPEVRCRIRGAVSQLDEAWEKLRI